METASLFRIQIAFAALLSLACSANAQFSQTPLPLPNGGTVGTPVAISGGQIAGTYGSRSILWNGTTNNIIDLNPPSFSPAITSLYGYRQGGYFVAYTTNGGGRGGGSTHRWHHACFWKGNAASFVDLNPGGARSGESKVFGVNNTNQVGWAGGHAYMWSGTAASAVDLNPPGFSGSTANAIHATHTVGFGVPSGGSLNHALLWTGSDPNAIDLNPTSLPTYASYATCVDDGKGIQGGYVEGFDAQSVYHQDAYIWKGTPDSGIDLAPAGSTASEVLGTRNGHEVGWATINGSKHAIYWSGTAASAIDLSPNQWPAQALGIDDNGDIVGTIGSTPVIWKRDATPHVVVTQSQPGDALGWNNGGVNLDVLSPFVSGTPTISYSVDGAPYVKVSAIEVMIPLATSKCHNVSIVASNGTTTLPNHHCTVNLDAVHPKTTYSYSNYVVTLNATDDFSGVASLNYILDGAQYSAPAGKPFQLILTNLPHILSYWSTDKAGNVESKHSVTYHATAPILSSIDPSAVLTTDTDLTLQITGGGFLTNAQVMWGNTPLTTTYLTQTTLYATVPASMLALPTTANITVVNPSPGGGASQSVAFAVYQQATVTGDLTNPSDNSDGFDVVSITDHAGFTLSGSTVKVATNASSEFYDPQGGLMSPAAFWDAVGDGWNVTVVGTYSNGVLTAWSVRLH
ncbi:MAG TPA: IPT/TIG domain-containing protein [Fimbriimonas sp.]|nr:IPT/TIG domain-containing protein [Fimbriimonas sp.]